MFAALIVLIPFGYSLLVPPGSMDAPLDDFSLGDAMRSPLLWIYALPIALICTVLIVRTAEMSGPTKVVYLIFTWLLTPIAALVLMHRLYWYHPLRTPRTVEEMREAIRAQAEQLKARDR